MKTQVVVLGSGGHARVVLSILMSAPDMTVAGIVAANSKAEVVEGVPVLGGDECLPGLAEQGISSFIIGVGSVGDSSLRRELYDHCLAVGLSPVNAVHNLADVDRSVRIGTGTVVMSHAVIQVGGNVGDNVIINTGAIIGHDCVIQDHAHVALGANLGGEVQVGEGAHIGMGASVRNGIVVGENAIVGVGAAVVKDVSPGEVVVGVPAKPLRKKKS